MTRARCIHHSQPYTLVGAQSGRDGRRSMSIKVLVIVVVVVWLQYYWTQSRNAPVLDDEDVDDEATAAPRDQEANSINTFIPPSIIEYLSTVHK